MAGARAGEVTRFSVPAPLNHSITDAVAALAIIVAGNESACWASISGDRSTGQVLADLWIDGEDEGTYQIRVTVTQAGTSLPVTVGWVIGATYVEDLFS